MRSDDLVPFFVPGLLHRFGNLLLTVQGHALHLDAGSLAQGRQAILGAAERGARALQVMRRIGGEHDDRWEPAGELLKEFVHLARVPTRERGHSLEARGELAAGGASVPGAEFVRTVACALCALLDGVPDGAQGAVVLALGAVRPATPNELLVDAEFEAAAGSLPFPLPVADVAARVAGACGTPAPGRIVARTSGLRLSFAARPSAAAGEASAGLHGNFPEPT